MAVGALILAFALASAAFGQRLSFGVVDREAITLPSWPLPAVAVRGDLYFLDYDQHALYRVSKPGAGVERIRLGPAPADEMAGLQVDRDLGVDAQGRFYVLATHRGAARLLVFGPEGAYDRTISFTPLAIVRRVVIDDEGSIFAIGSRRMRAGPRGPCFLIHKYDAAGRRVTSFSECPPPEPGRTETSQLWVGGGRVYHLLPEARELRVFDGSGDLVSSIHFARPPAQELLARHGFIDSSYAQLRVWNALLLPDGCFLVDWFHAGVRYLCLHGANGAPLSGPTETLQQLGAPVFVDRDGYCCFLRRLSDAQLELLRTRVRASASSNAPATPIAGSAGQ
ncbi:MAG TPA: hypothetical protein VEU62_23485 [Bryobacterales bacterium]|nr:hypothetical protein [Bryobacterales bacterium]